MIVMDFRKKDTSDVSRRLPGHRAIRRRCYSSRHLSRTLRYDEKEAAALTGSPSERTKEES